MIAGAASARPLAATPTVAATGWGESTFAEHGLGQSRSASLRWAVGGAVVGVLVGVVVFAPAAGWRAPSPRPPTSACCWPTRAARSGRAAPCSC